MSNRDSLLLYKLFLILKYLRKRRIAWVSLIAVTLCTAMVLIVISVMGGWLRMFRESFHAVAGDVIVRNHSLRGFPYYQEMINRIEKLPDVEAAAPIIKAYGLVNIINGASDGVQVIGLPIDKIAQINEFPKSLYRQYQQLIDEADDKTNGLTSDQRAKLRARAAEQAKHPSFDLPLKCEDYKEVLPKSTNDVCKYPGLIAGAGVLRIHKDQQGNIIGRGPQLYRYWIKLTVLPLEKGEKLSSTLPPAETFWVVDDSRTKVWQYDNNTVYVPFKNLQKDLDMMGTPSDPTDPARTSEIHVKIKPGANLITVRDEVQKTIDQVMADHDETVTMFPPEAETWEQVNSLWLGAIEKEKLLVTFLFGIISIVAIFLIFCIFYMIVMEKTKDIGILKAVGATSSGVAGIFLGYGLTIGIVGGLLGLGAGYGIVHNINYLHEQMGRLLHVQIWDPEVYAFDTIPNTMNTHEVIVIVSIAVIASVIGALVPAIRAARLNPVESLRWE